MTEERNLNGRKAIVTGGSQGLGHAIAERLARSGAAITVVDLPTKADHLPADWEVAAIDLASETAQDDLKSLADRLGMVDVVVANAGVVPPWRNFDELDAKEWRHVMAVNVWGVAATIGAFTASLEMSGHGSAIVMASLNGYRAHPKQALYTASKHAVIGLMRAAALDLGPRGIRVNALAPGPVATEALVARVRKRHRSGGPDPDAALAAYAAETALGKLVTVEDVANVAYFLASNESAGITGAVFPVEAGLA
ncbi:MAG: SDR family oxidoreductase [Gammaproteobacteria bacterium]|nr:SDR family oxidoreductase [Gammaproteobacteria bacterium]